MNPNDLFSGFNLFIRRSLQNQSIFRILLVIHFCLQQGWISNPTARTYFQYISNNIYHVQIEGCLFSDDLHPLILAAQQGKLHPLMHILQSHQFPADVLNYTLERLVFNADHFNETEHLDEHIQARADCIRAVIKSGASIANCPKMRMATLMFSLEALMFSLEASQEGSRRNPHALFQDACFKSAYGVGQALIRSGLNPMNTVSRFNPELSAIHYAILWVCRHHEQHPDDDLNTVLKSPVGQILLLFLTQGGILLTVKNIEDVEQTYPDLFNWLKTWYVMQLSLTGRHVQVPKLSEHSWWSPVHPVQIHEMSLNKIVKACSENNFQSIFL